MLRNKVVVVTGDAGAIGRCLVRGIVGKMGIAVAADIDIDAAKRSGGKNCPEPFWPNRGGLAG